MARPCSLMVILFSCAMLPAQKATEVKTVVYDLRDILVEPGVSRQTQAARLVQQIVGSVDPDSWLTTTPQHGTIQLVNGDRLEIRTTAARHTQIAELLQALRRMVDLKVTMKAELFEVDEKIHERIKNARVLDLEEYEKQTLKGVVPDETLFKLLDKQKPVGTNAVTVRGGQKTALLSQHRVVICGPAPGQKEPQAILEGVAFSGEIRVSADRRFVELKLAEKTTQLESIKKVKALIALQKESVGEVPMLRETSHSRTRDIPDGGSILIAVQARSKALEEKKRWWLLRLTPHIVVEEEEQLYLNSAFAGALPELVADLLKNPKLKAARDAFGTADDKQIALLKTSHWNWAEKLQIDGKEVRFTIPGYEIKPARRDGKRLLGIRIDDLKWKNDDRNELTVTVTLFNAGGSDNGPAVGGCKIRYTIRALEKGWKIELSESLDP